jgi:hypothetical protein
MTKERASGLVDGPPSDGITDVLTHRPEVSNRSCDSIIPHREPANGLREIGELSSLAGREDRRFPHTRRAVV